MTEDCGVETTQENRKRTRWCKAQAARRARLRESGTILLRLLCTPEEAKWITQKLLERRRTARMALRQSLLAADDASSPAVREVRTDEGTRTDFQDAESAAQRARRRKLRAMLAAHRARSG